MYLPIVDGKIDEEEEHSINFVCKSHNNFPVGWIVEIIKTDDNQFKGFTRSKNTYDFDESIIEKHQAQSFVNIQNIKQNALRKREVNITEKVESMTIKELKEWCKTSYSHRQAIRFYLQEVF